MPALGADMEKGRLVAWNVAPGSRVHPGDVVAVVETQKGAIDVEIFLDGVLQDLVPTGTELPVGAVLAQVRREDEPAHAPIPSTPDLRRMPPPPAHVPVPLQAGAPSSQASRARASPGARRRAAQLRIDPGTLQGTGPQGSVVLADVERAAATAARPPAAARGFDPAQMRAAIAAAMTRSKREIPHYYLWQAMDFGPAEQWLAAYNAQREPAQRLLPAVLLLKAAAVALAQVPQLNGYWREGSAQLSGPVHVGWAVTLRGGGLVVPAVHDVGRRSLPDLMRALRDLVERARSGGLRSSELTDATVTVTSLGDRGADAVLGAIYPPQLAVVGFGRIAPRPWIVDGRVEARPVVQASLAADHRASDGHLGARFLDALQSALLAPATLEGGTA